MLGRKCSGNWCHSFYYCINSLCFPILVFLDIEKDRITSFGPSWKIPIKSRNMDKDFLFTFFWRYEPESLVIEPLGESPFGSNIGQDVTFLYSAIW